MNDTLPTNFCNNEDVKYAQLRLVDIPAELRDHVPWFNQTLTTVNDAVVRLGIFEGDFPVPKNVVHRPRSPKRSAVLMVESLGIVATGD